MLPRLEIVRRLRPIDLVAPSAVQVTTDVAGTSPLPSPAPYVAATSGPEGALALHLGGHRLTARVDDGSVALEVTGSGTLRSRRFHRAESPTGLGLSLTGTHVTAWCREGDRWVARARHDLRGVVDTRDEAALAGLQVELPAGGGTAGGFGQLGVRDVRFVTDEDGTPLRDDDSLWLTATSAGPGFFDTAHTSVWRFDPDAVEVTHTADLFFRRPDRPGVFGDHATHLLRSEGRWLVATSTWGDFEQPRTRVGRRTPSGLRVTLAGSDDDLLHGRHVLDTRELPLPTDGLDSIATWDPHLVRRDGRWLVGFVSARRFFDFHPAVAGGPALEELHLLGAAADRTATEGTTLLDVDGELVVLASDGRDSQRGRRARFPVFDLAMQDRGVLDAPYPTNLPWPTLAHLDGAWLMASFNGRPAGGKLLGYGTHGDLVVMRSR
ncbi:hypothetical protein ASC64_02175 [Nocardioides sp. Root122]|uniref:hypothetical protein n=1 Tax=Nocardioides TaxID=1839 RepID=UPI0007038A3F|nr:MULTISPECIES: hypothetical protein [Nocardioides]KQV77661.1 hypothetical protein ASC64_02175 [Nocardioides sp. Root122]MCK9822116.1 hypothetical protein [Nocardioides cavernae]